MNLRYKILFTVSLLNEYFSNDVCDCFELIPSAETELLMKRYGLLHRMAGGTLIVLVKVDEVDAAAVPMLAATRLSFYLRIEDPYFLNVSNVVYDPSGELFYCSNVSGTQVTDVRYLNTPLPVYDASREYLVGDLVRDNTGLAYEAILPSRTDNAHNVSDALYWQKKDHPQYMHSGDKVAKAAGIFDLDGLAAASVFDIDFYGFNTATGDYDLPIRETMQMKFPGSRTAVSIPLEGISSGYYRAEVNGASAFVFVVREPLPAYHVFGVIDIWNHLPAANAFSLFDENHVSREPKFHLRFANRSVIWKYIARTADITAVTDTSGKYSFKTTGTPRQFVSVKPMPLKQAPLGTLQLTSTALSQIEPVANPRSDRLGSYTDENGLSFYCSEIFLNY